MAIKKTVSDSCSFFMNRIDINLLPAYSPTGDIVGLSGTVDAYGGYRSTATGDILKENLRQQNYTFGGLCAAAVAVGEDPQVVIRAFTKIFEARELKEVADNIAAV